MKTVSLRVVVIGLGTSVCILAADAPKQDAPEQRVQVSNTERVDFPSNGTLRLKNSTGELTIEAWDENAVEITTVKSTKDEYTSTEREKASQDLERIRIAPERKGDELAITADFPRAWLLPAYPLGGANGFYLEYHIKVPRDTKLIVEHYVGEVHVDGLTNDVSVTARQGAIILHLPESGQYAIDAKSRPGNVISDFPGTAKSHFWLGHQFTQASQAPHRLRLKDGFGDIVLLKTRIPQAAL